MATQRNGGEGQPRKDSSEKRVNFDNTREDKFKKDTQSSGKKSKGRGSRRGKSKKKDGSTSSAQGSKQADAEKKDEEFAKKGTGSTSSANDFEWYNRNPSLTLAATRLGSAYIAGKLLSGVKTTPPSVLAIYYSQVVPTHTQAVKTAQDMEYSFVMHANSRNYAYSSSDQNLFQLAGMSLISYVGMGLRVYGTMRRFTAENTRLPRDLVEAMGFKYDDLVKNYSIMWGDLNYMISMLSQIWVPTEIPLLYRWFWMNTKVFVDSESIKDQYYVLVPMGFWKLGIDSNGTCLTWVAWANKSDPSNISDGLNYDKIALVADTASHHGAGTVVLQTWQNYKDKFYDLLNALVEKQDRGVIYADLLRAFGTSKLFALADIPIDYTTEFAYEPEVLTMIMNASICPVLPAKVEQDPVTDTLRQLWPKLQFTSTISNTNIAKMFGRLPAPILNYKFADNPTPQALIEATRLCSRGLVFDGSASGTSGYINIRPKVYATEIVNGMRAFFGTYNAAAPYAISYTNMLVTAGQYYGSMSCDYLYNSGLTARIRAIMSAFDWRPTAPVNNDSVPTLNAANQAEKASDFVQEQYWVGDVLDAELENPVPVASDELERMHDVCILSEFGMPFDFSTFTSGK